MAGRPKDERRGRWDGKKMEKELLCIIYMYQLPRGNVIIMSGKHVVIKMKTIVSIKHCICSKENN